MEATCRLHGISHLVWDPMQVDFQNRVSLLLVSVEDIDDQQFKGYLEFLHTKGVLARIVFDEVHLFLTQEFRPKLRRALNIRTIPVQLLLLTATLPPALESSLKIAISSNFRTIRLPSNRPNISLRVIETEKNQLLPTLLKELWKQTLQPEERGLVYCMSIDDVELVVKNLKDQGISCLPYHSKLDDDTQKANADAWFQGTAQWMVATSGFGVGIHFPAVRAVFHFGGSYSIISYFQEVGRVGRDGKPAISVLITCQEYRRISAVIDKNETLTFPLWDWVDSGGCRRQNLSGAIDGLISASCRTIKNQEYCDRCQETCQ